MRGLILIFLSFCLVLFGCKDDPVNENDKVENNAAFILAKSEVLSKRVVRAVYISKAGKAMVALKEAVAIEIADGLFRVYYSDNNDEITLIKEFNDKFYAINTRNQVLSSTDGLKWTIEMRADSTLFNFVVLSSGDIIAGSHHGVFYKKNNADVLFSEFLRTESNFFGDKIEFLIESNSGSIFSGSHDGIHKSTDGGQSWTKVTSSISKDYDYITSLIITPQNNIIAGTDDFFYTSSDEGNSWSTIEAENLYPNTFFYNQKGMDYFNNSYNMWASKSDEFDFKSFSLSRLLIDNSLPERGLVESFYIRGDKIIIDGHLEVFVGKKNENSDFWKQF